MSETTPATPDRTEKAREVMKSGSPNPQPKTLVFVILVIVVVIAGLGYFVQSQRDTSGEAAPKFATPIGATKGFGFVRGDAAAPVKVVVYEDLACPACREFEMHQYDKLTEAAEAGEISVESRLLRFLDQDSKYSTRAFNTYLSVQEHAGSEIAEQLRLVLLVSQPEEGYADFTDEEIREFVKLSGATQEQVDAVKADQESLRFEQWITNAADAASKSGVRSTPWVTVNGEHVENPFEDLWEAVEDAK